MNTLRYLICLLLTAGCLSCGPVATLSGTLVDHTLWKSVPFESDPFKEFATDEVVCPAGGYKAEGEGADQILEVDTGICNFVTLEQPLPRGLKSGDTLDWSMWHLTLVFTEPAEAYAVLTIGEHTLWEKTMPIPSPAAAYSKELIVPADIEAGAPIRIHLHNHGNNSWRFHKLAVPE